VVMKVARDLATNSRNIEYGTPKAFKSMTWSTFFVVSIHVLLRRVDFYSWARSHPVACETIRDNVVLCCLWWTCGRLVGGSCFGIGCIPPEIISTCHSHILIVDSFFVTIHIMASFKEQVRAVTMSPMSPTFVLKIEQF
jgi:hypothetical protein